MSTAVVVQLKQGPAGPVGATGPTGATGPQGPPVGGTTYDGTTLNVTAFRVANTGDAKVTFQTIPVDILTTNASVTPLQVFSVGSTSGIVFIRGLVTSSDATATNTGAWSIDLCYKNVSGTLTSLGGTITPYGTPATAIAAAVSTGTVTINAVGIAATNIRWTCTGFQSVAVGT